MARKAIKYDPQVMNHSMSSNIVSDIIEEIDDVFRVVRDANGNLVFASDTNPYGLVNKCFIFETSNAKADPEIVDLDEKPIVEFVVTDQFGRVKDNWNRYYYCGAYEKKLVLYQPKDRIYSVSVSSNDLAGYNDLTFNQLCKPLGFVISESLHVNSIGDKLKSIISNYGVYTNDLNK